MNDANEAAIAGRQYAIVANDAKARVLQATVTDQPSLDWAGQTTQQLNQIRDAIDNERQKITAPMRQAINAANAFFKPATESIDIAVAHLKRQIATYTRTVNETRAARAIAGQQVELAPPTTQGIRVQLTEAWEIINESNVPREFCSPDKGKIEAYLRDGGIRAIPGVRFFQRETVVSGRKGAT